MNKWEIEYYKFLILVSIRKNIQYLTLNIDRCNRCIKEISSDFEAVSRLEKDKLSFIKKLEKTKKNLEVVFNIEDIKRLDELINNSWSLIFTLLKDNICSYEFSIINVNKKNLNEDMKKYYEILYDEKIVRETRHSYLLDTPIYVDILQLINFNNLEYIDIYSDLINDELYNPNMDKCASSNEFFWTMLPNPFELKENKFIDLNKKVLYNPKTNYHLLKNGSDLIRYYLNYLSKNYKCDSKEKFKYYSEIIYHIIKYNNCSTLDTYRDNGNWNIDMQAYIYDIFRLEYSEKFDIDELRRYLLSVEGIENQIKCSIMPTKFRNHAIEYYINILKENNISNEMINKVKMLKI